MAFASTFRKLLDLSTTTTVAAGHTANRRLGRKQSRTAREALGVPEVTTHSFRKTVADLGDSGPVLRDTQQMAINTSDWRDNFFVDPPSGNYGCPMKIMDGGMLLFQREDGGFLVVAPHAWKFIQTTFDFTKRYRPLSKAKKTPTR